MKCMKYLLALLVLSFSVFLLIFAKLYETNSYNRKENSSPNEILDDNQNNILWFLQISDLHISKFKDTSIVTDFRTFCSEVVDVVKPKVVCIK